VAGQPPLPVAQRPSTDVVVVSPEFFNTMGIPLRGGRTFDARDTVDSPGTIVVNEAFARKIFPGESAVGRQITNGGMGPSGAVTVLTIAGVVGDVRGSQLGAEPSPVSYRCTCQSHQPFLTRMRFIVRTTGDPRAAVGAVAGQVYAADRNQPVFDVKTMEERLSDALAPQRFDLLLIGAFGAIAVLAASGVYGVMSYLVARRTREIGIRMALGARPGQVERLVVSESLLLAALAVAVGLAGGWALTRYLGSMLYGVTTLDGATFASMPVVLAALAIAAAVIPARRAARIDPITALREE